MTPSQERALWELKRLHAAAPEVLEVVGKPALDDQYLRATISLRIGLREFRPGGLALNDREEFQLLIPEDFPFRYPRLRVAHDRFAGFPHVTWRHAICLYQSQLEWNPADGLFGFFDRLSLWLDRAARNDMDPNEGPLEPPHAATDFRQPPLVIRADAPVPAGTRWLGWAELRKSSNRVELTGWKEWGHSGEFDGQPAVAVILPEALPMEFPEKGADFFAALARQNIDRGLLLLLLAIAGSKSAEGEPLRLIMGFPMRRAADGAARIHITAWTADAEFVGYLRNTLPQQGDTERIESLRTDLADAIYAHFETSSITWCVIHEDRPEIVVRRDAGTPMAWFHGKKVLVLGCGGLGSSAAESIVRAQPHSMDVVDDTRVRPGILARQNFILDDIGAAKASAIADRLRAIDSRVQIRDFAEEAHAFLRADLERLAGYDVMIDCTASPILQMKIERDWSTLGPRIKRLCSFMIDAKAQRCIGIQLGAHAAEGPWSAYVRLKYALCSDGGAGEFVAAFYAALVAQGLFQPEPGCSDPTFSGSAADVTTLSNAALNLIAGNLPAERCARGLAFSAPHIGRASAPVNVVWPRLTACRAGRYRVLIAQKLLNQARAYVRQNRRLRSPQHETGGLVWGFWDEAAHLILLLDASGPPPDSRHDPGHFLCGTQGTVEEHRFRSETSHGACGFLGFWHTHPELPPEQSQEDVLGMTNLIAGIGRNQRRAIMLIFGRRNGGGAAGVYVYESQSTTAEMEFINVGNAEMTLEQPVA